jgi:DNA-binding PadR family transcriptional regulator
MKGTELGELEELVLLCVAVLYDDAYGISVMQEVKSRANRSISLSTAHVVLKRLEKKGFLSSRYEQPTEKREGRKKLLYTVTPAGQEALNAVRELRNNIWADIPNLAFNAKK